MKNKNAIVTCPYVFRRTRALRCGRHDAMAWFVTNPGIADDWNARAISVRMLAQSTGVDLGWFAPDERRPAKVARLPTPETLASRIHAVLGGPAALSDGAACPDGVPSSQAWMRLRLVLRQLRDLDDTTRGYALSSWCDLRPCVVDLWNDAQVALVLHELEI